jgi:hypothetical protein
MKKISILTLVLLLIVCTGAMAKGSKLFQTTGVISEIDSANQQIVVNGISVQVTSTTLIQMQREPISFDDLAVGMTVKICGKLDGDILYAEQITVKYLGK